MSLRQIAKQLGITPAYLSYMVNGKRPWRPDLYKRYGELVNTSVNKEAQSVNNGNDPSNKRGSTDSYINSWSGRWDSNPRPSPWQGDALPLSHFRSRKARFHGLAGAEGRNRTNDTWIFSPLLYL